MLIEIAVTNFRSIRERQTFSMVASGRDELSNSYFESDALAGLRILRSAALYGANASGKSNLLRALKFLKHLIRYSADESSRDKGQLNDPFTLDQSSASEPTEIEVTFLLDNVRYQYGVAVARNNIEKEWLVAYPKKIAQTWFSRNLVDDKNYEWNFSSYLKGEKQKLAERTRPDSLFISVASKWNHEQISKIVKYFRKTVRVIDHDMNTNKYSVRRYRDDKKFRHWSQHVLKTADVGISKIKIDEIDVEDLSFNFPDDMSDKMKEVLIESAKKEKSLNIIEAYHHNPDEDKDYALEFSDESDGTRRLFDLLGPWEDSLENGYVIFIDEIDRSLHTILSRELIRLFHDPKTNQSNAQLILTTHDTNLLDLNLFRRDQIWFTEKSKRNTTSVYSLYDFKPRKSEAIESGYLQGRFGAIPFIPDGLGD